MTLHRNPTPEAVRDLLARARRIAVVGLSPKPHRDSHRVARYLQARGYEVIPIYPLEGQILGARVYGRLRDVPGPVDLADVFRRSEELPSVFDDFLHTDIPAIWLQYGCIDEACAARAAAAGRTVVMDRCIMVDHAELIGDP